MNNYFAICSWTSNLVGLMCSESLKIKQDNMFILVMAVSELNKMFFFLSKEREKWVVLLTNFLTLGIKKL